MTVTDEVVLHEEAGEGFLLHLPSGRYFGLNRSGLIVWNALVEGVDPVELLAKRWPNRSQVTLRADAERLMHQLADAGLLSEVADEPDA